MLSITTKAPTNMKKTILASAALSVALATGAQSFTVVKTSGEKKGFNQSEVERIEFRPDALPAPDPEPVLIDFQEKMTGITPEEGLIDPDFSEQGLGRISIAMDGVFMIDTKAAKKIVLATPTDTVFSRKADDEGMYLYRDVMSGKTEFSYVVNPDGFRTPGVYHLYIPQGTYTDTKGNPLSATTRVYIVSEPAPAQSVTSVPAQGVVEKLDGITFSFDSYPIVQSAEGIRAYLYKDGSSMIEAILATQTGADGTVTIEMPTAVTDGGLYRISIPEGVYGLRREDGGKAYTSKEVNLYFEIKGGTQPSPRVGDFYYSDGSWSPYPVDRGEVKPIGVIYYLGEATRQGDSKSRYTYKGGEQAMDEIHGYVIALRDATWHDGEHHGASWSFWNGGDTGCGCSQDVTDFLGYSNTRGICERAERDFGGLTGGDDNFPATWYATEKFEQEMPAPATSSGWFLPSAGQMKYIYDSVYFDPKNGNDDARYIERSLSQLEKAGAMQMYDRGSSYWTSTEEYDAYGKSNRAKYFSFDSTVIKPGFIGWANKGGRFRVRPMLVF